MSFASAGGIKIALKCAKDYISACKEEKVLDFIFPACMPLGR